MCRLVPSSCTGCNTKCTTGHIMRVFLQPYRQAPSANRPRTGEVSGRSAAVHHQPIAMSVRTSAGAHSRRESKHILGISLSQSVRIAALHVKLLAAMPAQRQQRYRGQLRGHDSPSSSLKGSSVKESSPPSARHCTRCAARALRARPGPRRRRHASAQSGRRSIACGC